MTKTYEYDIDTETGLPALPEGYWWRVGDVSAYARYGGSTKRPGVAMMTKTKQAKRYSEQVLGTKWWNKGKVLGIKDVTREELLDYEKFSESFSERSVPEKEADQIPEFALNRVEYVEWSEDHLRISYDLPLNEKSVEFLADQIMQNFLRVEESNRQREEECRIAVATRERLYGDYPPKKLESV
jgi:hypothetical protein